MKRLATMLCGLMAAFALFLSEARAEKRVALVIGNGGYQNASKLTNPPNDAAAIAAMFRDAGFEVVEAKTDLGNLEFKRVVREFTAIARDSEIAVLFFAGHGIEVNGTNYLIPVDAKLATDFDVEDESLSLDRLMRALEPAKRLRLIILDACRDNPFTRNMQRTVATRAVVNGLAKVEPATSDTLIAFATKPGFTADDGGAANSPFTAALLKHLTVPGRDVRIALGFTRDEVLKSTNGRQEPFVSGSLGGATVTLVSEKKQAEPKREIVIQPSAVPPPGAADPLRDYEFAERVGTREAWDSFLSVHSSGFYADLARAQRDKLAVRGAPAAPVAPAARKPANISVLPPPGAARTPEPEPEAKPDLAEVTRNLQTELRRIGCDAGRVDGNWSPRWQEAMSDFNQRAGTKLEVKTASLDALDAVKGQRGRICPLVCGRGQRADGEQCVAIPAPPKIQPKKQAVREPEPAPRARARDRARTATPERRVVREAPARPQPVIRQEASGSRPDRHSLGAD